MNEIIDQFLFTEDKFMPKLHLKQSEHAYSVYKLFTKHREKIQKFK